MPVYDISKLNDAIQYYEDSMRKDFYNGESNNKDFNIKLEKIVESLVEKYK